MSTHPRDRPHRTRLIVALLAAALLGLLVWGFVQGRREQALERAREQPVRVPSRVSEDHGEVVVTLDVATQARSAIRTAPLVPTKQRAELRGFATVVDLQTLGADRVAYAQARADLAQAQAALAASSRELERTQILNRDDKNLSDKALEAAQASQRADRARAQATDTSARLRADAARQHWGPVIAGWFATGAAPLQRLLSLQDVLLRVALPVGAKSMPFPETVRIGVGPDGFTTAYLVSAAPEVDPQLQAATAFYRAAAVDGLQPGRNVDLWLPQGDSARSGAVVPQAAVVWWQGRAWIYLQQGPTRFVRREIDTRTPVADGYLVTDQNVAGQQGVVAGAQLLLSEEFRAQIQVGEEGKE